jgi:hypothetical protein
VGEGGADDEDGACEPEGLDDAADDEEPDPPAALWLAASEADDPRPPPPRLPAGVPFCPTGGAPDGGVADTPGDGLAVGPPDGPVPPLLGCEATIEGPPGGPPPASGVCPGLPDTAITIAVTIAATAAMPPAAVITCPRGARGSADLVAGRALGKPLFPNDPARCPKVARCATALGSWLEAIASSWSLSPAGAVPTCRTASAAAAPAAAMPGNRLSSIAGRSSRRWRSEQTSHRPMCRLTRLRSAAVS